MYKILTRVLDQFILKLLYVVQGFERDRLMANDSLIAKKLTTVDKDPSKVSFLFLFQDFILDVIVHVFSYWFCQT